MLPIFPQNYSLPKKASQRVPPEEDLRTREISNFGPCKGVVSRQTKAGWAWTLAGMLAGLVVIPVAIFGGHFGQIVLGILGMGTWGIVFFGLLPYVGTPAYEGSWIDKELALVGGMVGGIGGMIAGGIMGACGQPFAWWIWPFAIVGGMALSALLVEWVHDLWLQYKG